MPQLTVRNKDLIRLQRGLKALETTQDGKRLEFSTETRWKMAKNLVMLERSLDIYSALENKMMEEAKLINGEKLDLTPDNRENLLRFYQQKETLSRCSIEITLSSLTRHELEEKNSKLTIPQSILADIWEIIELPPEVAEGGRDEA